MDGAPWAVTASEDRTVALWDIKAGARLAAFTAHYAVQCCAVAGAERHILAGDRAGGVHILRIELPAAR